MGAKLNLKILEWSLIILPLISFAGAIGLLIVIVKVFIEYPTQITNSYLSKILILISLLLVVHSCTAFKPLEALIQLANFIPLFFLFLILPFVVTNIIDLKEIIQKSVVISIPISLLNILQFIVQEHRPESVFDNPNTLASYLVVILGFELGLFLDFIQSTKIRNCGDKKASQKLTNSQSEVNQRSNQDAGPQEFTSPDTILPPKVIGQFCLLISMFSITLLSLFFSGSRNGLITSLIQLLVVIYSLVIIFRLSKVYLWISLAVLSGVGAIAFQWLIFGLRQLSLERLVHDPRLEIWRVAISLIQEHPFWGWGLGSYKLLYPFRSSISESFTHPHNFWLLIAVELGLPLLIILNIFVGHICFSGIRFLLFSPQANILQNSVLIGCLLGFGGCVTTAFFDCTFYDIRVNVMNWVALSGIYICTQLQLKPSNN